MCLAMSFTYSHSFTPMSVWSTMQCSHFVLVGRSPCIHTSSLFCTGIPGSLPRFCFLMSAKLLTTVVWRLLALCHTKLHNEQHYTGEYLGLYRKFPPLPHCQIDFGGFTLTDSKVLMCYSQLLDHWVSMWSHTIP